MNHPSEAYFLAACGSSEPLRISVGRPEGEQIDPWTFQQPFLVIGRRPESDLKLDHWQVSRRHAYLQLIEGHYYCVDLGSRTGTHGGDATERSGWLVPGRDIQIGPFAVRPEWPTQGGQSFGPQPGVTWELPGRSMSQVTWRMDRHLVMVGRSPACKIRIVEPDVSKFHCSLVLTPNGVWVVDLLGQNGTFVNDVKYRCARLEDGDILRVGRHTLRLRYDTPPLPLPSSASLPTPAVPGTQISLIPPSPFHTTSHGIEVSQRLLPATGQNLAAFPGSSGGAIDPSVNLLVHQFGMMQQQMFDQFHQAMMMMFEGFAALHREQANTIREEFDEVRKLSQEIETLRLETARLAEAAASRPPDRQWPAPTGHPPLRTQPAPNPARLQLSSEPIKRAAPPLPDPEVDIHAQLCLRLSTIENERQNRWQKILGMMSSRS